MIYRKLKPDETTIREGDVAAREFYPIAVSEQRCKTCRHWLQNRPEYPSFGSCEAFGHGWPHDLDDPVIPDEPTDLAFTLGYEVDDFYTRPGFGCVLWEPKQAPEV